MTMKLWMVALAGLASAGCVSFRTVTVGLAQHDDLVPSRVTALACINAMGGANGSSGTLREGQLDGAPAVSIEGVGPWGALNPTLVERRAVGKIGVWVGYRCRFVPGSPQGAQCEHSALFKNGRRRVYLWGERHYPTSASIPPTVDDIVAQIARDHVAETVASLDISDPDSQRAFAALQDVRFWRALDEGLLASSTQLAANVTTFAALTQMQTNIKYNMAKVGDSAQVSQRKREGWEKGAELTRQAGELNRQASEEDRAAEAAALASARAPASFIDPRDRPFFDAHPRLLQVPAVLAALAATHTPAAYLCVDRPTPVGN